MKPSMFRFTPVMATMPMRHFSIIKDASDFDKEDAGAAAAPGLHTEAAAKASAKDFLNKVEEDLIIDEITTVEQWTTKVMDVKDKPIILDFYADWCAPCKKLTPKLEQATQDAEGKFKLIKCNIDNLPNIATALQVRSIPTLFLIYRGNVMDQMTGVDDAKMEELIKTAVLIEQAQHDESIMHKVLSQSQEMIEEGKWAHAEQVLRDGSSYEQWMTKFAVEITTGIAYCQLMITQDTKVARDTLAPLTEA